MIFYPPHCKTFTLLEHVPTKKSLDRQKPLLQPNLKLLMKHFTTKLTDILCWFDWIDPLVDVNALKYLGLQTDGKSPL